MTITYYAGNHWTGTFADRDGLTTTNLIAGLMFLETNTDDLYQWDGDSWNVISGDAIAQILELKTLISPILTTPQINDSASDHQYVFAVGNLAANRTVTLPVLTDGDTIVFEDHAQALTGKTIVAGSNTISGIVNANLSGSAAISNANLANSGITMAAESGSNDAIALGETFTFTAGEGIDTTMGTNAVTIAGEDASASNKGIASFSSNDFSISSGAVTIKSGGVTDAQLAGSIANGKLANSAITIGGTAVSLGGTITALTALTDVDLTSGNKTVFDGVGSNTLTIGAGGTTVVVAGNLTVSGTTTTVNTATLSIEDPLMLLSNGASGSASVDAGFVIERGSDTNVALLWDESTDQFATITTSDTGTTAGNVTIAGYANFRAATIDGTTITASSALGGTLSTAAQANVTSVGTLTGLTVSGNAVFQGTVGLGNATGDTITATGYFGSALIPSADDTYDLGASSGGEWRNLYLDGTANIDVLTADAGTVGGSAIVTLGATQTLAAKTFTAPVLATYMDFTKISAPSDPGIEVGRMYLKEIDSNNNAVAIKIQKSGVYSRS